MTGVKQMFKNTHLIVGKWICARETFTNELVNGLPDSFASGILPKTSNDITGDLEKKIEIIST
jgi:hypothetical protein